jgi:hypothetical protein
METNQEYIRRVNALTEEELDALIAADQCPFEPERLPKAPIGMFHCYLCGEMVVAGVPHPRSVEEGSP